MQNITSTALSVLALAVLLAGCDAAGDTLTCPESTGLFTIETSRVTGSVSLDNPPTEPMTRGDQVVVRGSATHEDALAIREVLVGGVSAELVRFNFREWAATLRYEDVVLASEISAEGEVQVPLSAVDACGLRYPFAVLSLPVDPTPNLNADSLALTVSYPGERGFVPASASAAATLTVTATGQVAGARVALTAQSGRFQGLDAQGRVRLVRDDNGSASGTVLYFADTAGTAIIRATLDDELATALVVAAAAPAIRPRQATLVPGAALEVEITSPGTVSTCQISDSEALTATHNGASLGPAPSAMTRVDGAYRVLLAASPQAPETDEVTLLCTDAYGQVGAGTFSVQVDTPPQTVDLTALAIAVTIPQSRDHLPADGSASGLVTVTAAGKADGALVTLTATGGTLQGVDAFGRVTLSGDEAQASASVFFTGHSAGTGLLVVSGDGLVATETVAIVGPPLMSPAGAQLVPGQTLDVAVSTSGQLRSCQATPDPVLIARTADGDRIGAAPTAVGDGAGQATLSIRAADDDNASAQVAVDCQDVWGQFVSGAFRIGGP